MTNIKCIDISAPRKALSSFYDETLIRYKAMPCVKQNEIKTIVKCTETALVITIVAANPTEVLALDISEKVISALDPLIGLIQSLGYPLAVLSMSGGAITMMFNKRMGVRIIKDTGIAFLALQFVPGLMKILLEIGRALR